MKHILSIAACSAFIALASSANANVGSEQTQPSVKASVSAIAPASLWQLAKHGADDPPGDDRGGRRGGKGGKGRGGHDDGPNHT